MHRLAIAIVLASACGTDSVSLESYALEARDAHCRYLVKCGEIESAAACAAANFPLGFPVFSARDIAAIEAGKASYSGESAASCLDGRAARSCDVTSQSNRFDPDACRQITRGTLRAGASCTVDIECLSQTCAAPFCGQACCTGMCSGDTPRTSARLGESCENAFCDARSFCDDATLTCMALKSQGQFCASPFECQYGLDCDATAMCTPLPGLGEPCTGACRDDGTTCSPTSQTCVKVGLVGAACAASSDCSPLYRCDDTGHCTAGVKLGLPCVANQQCADAGAFCEIPDDAITGTCVLPRDNGQGCTRGAQCQSGYCDPTSARCAAEPVCQ